MQQMGRHIRLHAQGREADIVIFSCVRARSSGRGSIGFLADVRRMNVGITRARWAPALQTAHAMCAEVIEFYTRSMQDVAVTSV